MEDRIFQLAEKLNLNIETAWSDEVARIYAKPTQKLIEALNLMLGKKYYTDWAYEMDYVLITISKEFTLNFSTWVEDVEINDSFSCKNCSFDVISILMNLVEE